ncbi:helix-turn-helix domain-containing protein [Anaerosporobacter faecicola]|uniref:helix-turn-helix domain-containing protein n=1 Tax=Anaerosporobacter faecicola TaxID=2718714 RepID=UPI00143979D2|nr:helix-turn-helix domain-containing protein [Anaerosporobacter faecicola]
MQTIVSSSDEFRRTVLQELAFQTEPHKNYVHYHNPEKPSLGQLLLYERTGCYTFAIADFTIPHPFQITFDNPEHLIRFGIVYLGSTNYKLENQSVSSFKPSSFFVIEKEIRGRQAWSKGEHYKGAEVTIYESYIKNYLKKTFSMEFDYSKFIENVTYPYLPVEVITILEKMQLLSSQEKLNTIYLESCILECIAIISQTMETAMDNAFTRQLDFEKITIGKNRTLILSASDLRSIVKAQEILTSNLQSPPTIEHLSELVFLNPQKLKAGFSYYYHMPIGQYITSLRMSMAVKLLRTTELSIAEIASQVGYPYTSNFIKIFRKTYHCTPLAYRQNQENKAFL